MPAHPVDSIHGLSSTNVLAATLVILILQKLQRKWHDLQFGPFSAMKCAKTIKNHRAPVVSVINGFVRFKQRTRLKYSRLYLHDPSTSWRPHFAPATHLGRRKGTAQTAFTQRGLKATSKRQSCHKLVIGNWNISLLTRKEHELVERAKRYSMDIVSISKVRRRGSGRLVESRLLWRWATTQSTRCRVGIHINHQLVTRVNEWIPLEGMDCMLGLTLLDRSLRLVLV